MSARETALAAVGAVGLGLAAGCSLTAEDGLPAGPAPSGASGAESGPNTLEKTAVSLISQDFANALRQIDRLDPRRTTLQFRRDGDLGNPFVASLRAALIEVGYGVQLIEGMSGDTLVRHRVSRGLASDIGPTDVYEISVGPVILRREYHVPAEGGVEPATALYVKGARTSGMLTDDSVFGNVSSALHPQRPDASGVRAVRSSGEGVSAAPATARSIRAIPGGDASGGAVLDVEPDIEPSEAVAEAGSAERAWRAVILFRRGSFLLDERDVDVIDAALERFDPERETITLVGCSSDLRRVRVR